MRVKATATAAARSAAAAFAEAVEAKAVGEPLFIGRSGGSRIEFRSSGRAGEREGATATESPRVGALNNLSASVLLGELGLASSLSGARA